MRTKWATWVAIAGLLVAGGDPAAAQESSVEPSAAAVSPVAGPVRYEDPAGDQEAGIGADILVVTASQPDVDSLRFSVELAPDAALTYDLETMSTDMLWVVMATRPGAFEQLPDGGIDVDYITAVHGATLPRDVEEGAHLYVASGAQDGELLENVVDVTVADTTITLTVGLDLLARPDEVFFEVWSVTEGQEETSGGDGCPNEGQGHIILASG
jgi:hypothetical protein